MVGVGVAGLGCPPPRFPASWPRPHGVGEGAGRAAWGSRPAVPGSWLSAPLQTPVLPACLARPGWLPGLGRACWAGRDALSAARPPADAPRPLPSAPTAALLPRGRWGGRSPGHRRKSSAPRRQVTLRRCTVKRGEKLDGPRAQGAEAQALFCAGDVVTELPEQKPFPSHQV